MAVFLVCQNFVCVARRHSDPAQMDAAWLYFWFVCVSRRHSDPARISVDAAWPARVALLVLLCRLRSALSVIRDFRLAGYAGPFAWPRNCHKCLKATSLCHSAIDADSGMAFKNLQGWPSRRVARVESRSKRRVAPSQESR